MSGPRRAIVVGAGLGGLAAAVDLARQGLAVTVLERAATPGGKMRAVTADGAAIDAGPTVFTMRWVFESLFADAGARLEERLRLQPAAILARHAWVEDKGDPAARLDLFADVDRSADAIAAFAGSKDAAGYRALVARSKAIHDTLRDTFMAAQKPTSLSLAARLNFDLGALWRTAPFTTLWNALGRHIADHRLRQLFARYATYVGASPFRAPATLMLIAHVEQDGVWLVDGGMRRIADALQALAEAHGARFRFNAEAARIETVGGRAAGVSLAEGERLDADAVVFNGDPAALATGLLGDAPRRAAPPTRPEQRSLSAVTWCVRAQTSGFPLKRHTVFFGSDYRDEFAPLVERPLDARSISQSPTVYICAQDRGAGDRNDAVDGRERLLVLINAPAIGDRRPLTASDHAALAERAADLLARCGLRLEGGAEALRSGVTTGPQEFHNLFPATGGALYGRATHGPFAAFDRPGAASRLPGLYLCGGGVHPGAGVPMATLSGRLAAARVVAGLR